MSDFIFKITTTGAAETFTIPCQNVGVFNATIDWGDGGPTSAITAYDDADLTHTYATANTYTITVSGTFTNIYFNNEGDKDKIIEVVQLGSVGWLMFNMAFWGCSNLTAFTAAPCDTSSVTDMSYMMASWPSMTSPPDLSGFDTSSVTNMGSIMREWPSMTSPPDLSGFDTSLVTNMGSMMRVWTSMTSPPDLSGFDTSLVTNMSYMMYQWSSMTSPPDLSGFDTSSVTNMGQMMREWPNTLIPSLAHFNMEAVTVATNMLLLSTMATADYDATLEAWAAQNLKSGVSFHGGNSEYSPYTVYGTDALGDPLAETPWLWFQPGPRTNAQIQSNDQTDVEWTATNVTPLQDAVGLEGVANTACTLTATAGNGTVIANALTAASDNQTTRWFLKRKTGTGNIDLTLDNGASWTTVAIDGDFDEYLVDQAALANPQIGIRIVTSGDEVIVGNAEAYTATQKEEVEGLGPIFTAGAEASTDRTVYENQNTNIDNDGSAIYFELYSTTDGGFANPSAAEARIFDFGNGWLGQDRTTGAATLSDATNTVTGPVINEGANQIGVVWSTTDNQMAICVNGVWSTDSAYDGTMTGVSNIKIGIDLDHCIGIRLGKGYVGIEDLAAGKDIIDGLMA